MDRSGSGWGLKWDYIIIHESGHEWFGNNITTEDIADMWVHEGFTDYSETIYTECQSGTEAGVDYVVGLRKGIANDRPLIGPYGVNQEGRGDMYNKGANLVHTIRAIMDDDARFKAMLRDMNSAYHHQTVTSGLIEGFISERVGRDLSPIFDQYLRTTQIPVFEWKIEGKRFHYRWADCNANFLMPVKVKVKDKEHLLETSTEWQALDGKVKKSVAVAVDRNWYVGQRRVK
jgi:aminopeptidase N